MLNFTQFQYKRQRNSVHIFSHKNRETAIFLLYQYFSNCLTVSYITAIFLGGVQGARLLPSCKTNRFVKGITSPRIRFVSGSTVSGVPPLIYRKSNIRWTYYYCRPWILGNKNPLENQEGEQAAEWNRIYFPVEPTDETFM